MVKEVQGKLVLPIREQRILYDDFSQKFKSQIPNDENQIADAGVEADELENAEEDSECDNLLNDGSSKIVS
jgi:hypothetical protein